ncbi:MAG TPA: hypothetical protein DIC45_12830 [Comamonadaceae bacterium]|nr:hypothetical protein [Comamonadaceae bacterium]
MHKNQFDRIRILAALVVIFSHHYPLTGTRAPAVLENQWLHWSVTGGVGVMVFFCISGYLVTLSWYREPHLLPFLWKRLLRLWPGMLGSVLCGIFLFGLLFNSLTPGQYLNSPTTWRFFWTNLSLLKEFPFLAGTFPTNPIPNVMNGVYWTIPMEFACYLILAFLGLVTILRRPRLIKCLLLLYMAGFLWFANPDFIGNIRHWIEYPAFFAAGAFIALHKNWFDRYGGKLLLVATPVLAATYFLTPYIATSRFLLLPALVIYLGNLPARDNWFSRLGDPSYGIYLYGYPIAQTVVALWPDMHFWASLALTCALSIGAGYASWLLLESRALRYKGVFTARKGSTERAEVSMSNLLGRLPWTWLWPALACFVGLRFIVRHLDDPVSIDATHLYLPMAGAFLEQGWSALLRPESYHAAPLSYLWPALWGAEPTWIRIAHMGLWVGCVFFVWRTCQLLGGSRTAALAMLLMLSPALARYFPSELTEPIYLFGLFGWMHAMARMIAAEDRSWGVALQGAAMLTITLLSRPVLQFIAPVMLLLCLAAMAYWPLDRQRADRPSWRQSLPVLAWSLGGGLVLPGAVVIKNGLVFGLWALGTGSGIGLYLGTHPLAQGAEPFFLGLGYDVNLMVSLAQVPDDLRSVAGDAAARHAAIWQLQSMTPSEAFAFFGRKLWWWLAHHPVQVQDMGSVLRKLRLFELGALLGALLWLALSWLRRSSSAGALGGATSGQWALAGFMLAMFLGMLAQLLPILHNSRYSSALLDPWLVPLAAFALALLTRPIALQFRISKDGAGLTLAGRGDTSPWPALMLLAVIVALALGGYNLARKHEQVAIDITRMGNTQVLLELNDAHQLQAQGMTRNGNDGWITTQTPAALLVPLSAQSIERVASTQAVNALWETELSLQPPGQRCRKAEVAYQLDNGAVLQPANTLPLTLHPRSDGSPEHIVTHANYQLRPEAPGYLRLVFDCPVGTHLRWRVTRLLESRHASDAARAAVP